MQSSERNVPRRQPRIRRAAALCCSVGFAVIAAAPTTGAEFVERLPRLPRAQLDVIPPEERVRGEPGQIAVWQEACRSGPTEWSRRRIVDIATQEWAFFGFQTIDAATPITRLLPPGVVSDLFNPEIKPRIAPSFPRLGMPEGVDAAAAVIAGYWSATPDGSRVLLGQNRAWTGPGRNAVNWLQPWSAAFISWVMCEAGLGSPSQFERDISHRVYVDQAIRARDGEAPEAAFVAHDPGETEIVPGDLLCNARGAAEYTSLADRRLDFGTFAPTHCDIVVKVDAMAMRILVIGGNVEQSVSLTILPALRETGRALRPVDEASLDGARTIFAHLSLRAPPIEATALENTPTIRSLRDPLITQSAVPR